MVSFRFPYARISADMGESHLVRNFGSHVIVSLMETNPLTAKAEATQFPNNWGIYWNMRTVLKYTVRNAKLEMTKLSPNNEWHSLDEYQLRKLEMLCLHTIVCMEPAPCVCVRCR